MNDEVDAAGSGPATSRDEDAVTSSAPLRRRSRAGGAARAARAAPGTLPSELRSGAKGPDPDFIPGFESKRGSSLLSQPVLDVLRLAWRIVAVVIAIWAALAGAERLLFEFPAMYPMFLIEGVPGYEDLRGLRARCGAPLQVNGFEDQALVRCGAIWPTTHVWLVTAPQRPGGLPK